MLLERFRIINNKIYDTKCPNKSFLKLAVDLKKAGVKEWYFALEIKDVSLAKVDPHAIDKKTKHTTLTKNEIQRVMYECKSNLWYYLREVSRIPEAGAPTGVKYKANRGNIAQAWCLLHGIDSWLCLPRQQGKTLSALALILWVYSFGTTNSHFIFINKDGENAKENLRRIKDQIKVLPEYLQFNSIMTEDDGKIVKAISSATRMQHPVTNNQITIKSKATSYDQALSIARGLTAPILHFDEPEFTNHIKTIVENSVSTFDTAARKSKENGSIYGRIFTCTPGDLDTAAGMEAQLLLEHTVKWTEEMYSWSEEKREEYISRNKSNRIVYIEYNYHQIGLSEKWFKEISEKIGDALTVRREILLQRLRGSDTSPYPRDDIEQIINNEQRPIGEFFLQDYFRVVYYEELVKKIPYIVGVDCSTGTLGDNNAITIINPYTLKVAAEFECAFLGETAYENCLKELIKKHIPRGVLCIERNSIGDGIIDHLLHSEIVSNLYFDRNKDLLQEKMNDNSSVESILKRKAQEKPYYGVYTQGKSREAMFAILSTHVHEKKDCFVGHNVIRDISRLVKKSNGRIEAGNGFHDDSVMSYLIGLYVYYHGNNLSIFGIEPGVMGDVPLNQGLDFENQNIEDISIDSLDIGTEAKEDLKAQQNKAQNTVNYEEMLREAIYESQRQSQKMYQSDFVHNSIYEDTPEHLLEDDYSTNDNCIPLDFFTEINNF